MPKMIGMPPPRKKNKNKNNKKMMMMSWYNKLGITMTMAMVFIIGLVMSTLREIMYFDNNSYNDIITTASTTITTTSTSTTTSTTTPAATTSMIQQQEEQQQYPSTTKTKKTTTTTKTNSTTSATISATTTKSKSKKHIWPDPTILQNLVKNDPTNTNTVILLSTNCGYVNMAHNWIVHARMLNVDNFLIVAQDPKVYQILHNFVPGHVVLLEYLDNENDDKENNDSNDIQQQSQLQQNLQNHYKYVSKDSFTFSSYGFNMICKQRPYMIQSIVQQGYNVLYTDIDLVWIKNPLKRIQYQIEKIQKQKQIQKSQQPPPTSGGSALTTTTTTTHPTISPPPIIEGVSLSSTTDTTDSITTTSQQSHHHHHHYATYDYIGITDTLNYEDVCTGLMYFSPTNNTFELLHYWSNLMLQNNDDNKKSLKKTTTGHDQNYWRQTIKDLNGRHTNYILSIYEFPPGFFYFDNLKYLDGKYYNYRSNRENNHDDDADIGVGVGGGSNSNNRSATATNPHFDSIYTVHANWMKGISNKIKHLKSKHHWLINYTTALKCVNRTAY